MNGLNDKEVLELRKKYGTNAITGGKRDSFFKMLLESFFFCYCEMGRISIKYI